MQESLCGPPAQDVAFCSVRAVLLQFTTRIDQISEKILQELSRDGRISNLELAGRVGLSPWGTLRRVQELERAGVITRYRARLSRTALDRGFLAYMTVGLSTHTKAAQEAFERAIAKAPQVQECHNVTGAVEYPLRVEVADLAAYKTFHTEVLGALPQVASITTFVVLASSKDERA